jgi:hypothetical protein
MSIRPWERVRSGARPWEEGGLANRTISIARENLNTGAGIQPVQEFNGAQRALVNPIATKVPCSIEIARDRGRPLGEEPGDIQARSTWRVMIAPGDATAANLAAAGAIQTRDVLTDDAGLTYQVAQPEWHVLGGWRIAAELLQA